MLQMLLVLEQSGRELEPLCPPAFLKHQDTRDAWSLSGPPAGHRGQTDFRQEVQVGACALALLPHFGGTLRAIYLGEFLFVS